LIIFKVGNLVSLWLDPFLPGNWNWFRLNPLVVLNLVSVWLNPMR
jgi:hypothetical protein